jgi:hypothetical protein
VFFVKAATVTLHRDIGYGMTQDERWVAKYNEVVEFIEANHRNPSKHRIEMYILVEVGNIRKNKKGLTIMVIY